MLKVTIRHTKSIGRLEFEIPERKGVFLLIEAKGICYHIKSVKVCAEFYKRCSFYCQDYLDQTEIYFSDLNDIKGICQHGLE